jgi:5'-3' exonuclease
MGIKALSKFLRESYPDIFELIHISEYHFKKIAIDTSLYLCNYKALYGEEGWLGAFVKLVACLRENEIHCVLRLEERVSNLERAIEHYHNTGEIEEILLDFQSKKRLHQKSMLRPRSVNINAIEFAVKKMRKQLFSISYRDFVTTKQLFDILKVPYYHAPLEAETMCADLCMQGKVDAVLSEDTDVLAYGANTFLTKINTTTGTCIRLKHVDMLNRLGVNANEFLDFCIMCGTDYNKNIFKIGPSKALKLIEQYKNIEKVHEETKIDISILNHVRVRQLFREFKKSTVEIPYCGAPEFDVLQNFLVKKNLHLNVDSLKKSFLHNTIVFEDDDESDKKSNEVDINNFNESDKKSNEIDVNDFNEQVIIED